MTKREGEISQVLHTLFTHIKCKLGVIWGQVVAEELLILNKKRR